MGTISRPKKLGILRQDHFRYEDDRVLDVVLMGNKAPLGRDEGEGHHPRQVRHQRGGRQPAGRAGEASSPRRTATAPSPTAAALLEGLGIAPSPPRGPHEAAHRRPQAARAARPGALRQAPGAAARRAHQQPGHRLHPLAGDVPHGVRGRAHHHQPRPALPQRHLHAHRGHRLRDHHPVHRRLRRHGAGRRPRCARRVESENSEKKKKIAQLQDFVARFHAGTRASQVQSRIKQIDKLKIGRPEALEHRAALHPLRAEAGQRQADAAVRGHHQELRRPEGHPALQRRWCPRARRSASSARNGVGKSTLVKMLAGQMEPDAGKINWGHQASVGYLPQDHHGTIRKGTTAFELAARHRRPSSPTRRSPACSAGCSSRARSG